MAELRTKSSLMLCAFVFLFDETAWTAQDVIYKDPRPRKKLFDAKEKSEEEKVEVPYLYDPTGKTDPFKSFIAIQEELAEKKRKKPRTYLETLDLSQLELIAIIVGPKGNFAMVRDSKGTGHVIKKGTPIGTKSGVVTQITEMAVMVREEYRDFRGKTKYKDVAKKLPTLE